MNANSRLATITHTLLFALSFFTPLLVFPSTSEAFEFNKMVFVYAIALGMITLWAVRSLAAKKLLFKHTPLDIPLLAYLFVVGISTALSIDPHVSMFGVYGRFNGGFLSTISYAIIYWTSVILVDKKTVKKALQLAIASGVIVSIIAVIEHFGTSLTCLVMTGEGIDPLTHIQTFDHTCWSQDFQTRVFSTLGQPNWLAAWLTALSPLAWSVTLEAKGKRKIIMAGICLLFLSALIFTKSRSGVLGVGIAAGVFLLTRFFTKTSLQKLRKPLVAIAIAVVTIVLLTQTSSLLNLTENSTERTNDTIVITNSLTIRKYVWQGALSIWNDYKLLGSGPETFALMFPRYKPVEFNTTSEWDFVFNKSHNQYLDVLSNTGILGILTYVSISIVFLISAIKKYRSTRSVLVLGIISGYVSLLVTQFFGFQVVATSLFTVLLFIALFSESSRSTKYKKLNPILIIVIIVLALYSFYSLGNYWRADVYYNNAVDNKFDGQFSAASIDIKEAINLNPYESLYLNELADIQSYLAVMQSEQSHEDIARELATQSLTTSEQALVLSPHNHTYLERRSSMLIRMSGIESTYLIDARDSLELLVQLLPNDPEIRYNYALLLARTNEPEQSIEHVTTAIELKSNYKAPRFLKAKLLIANDDTDSAIEELQYIRQYIDPFDENVNELYETLISQ